MGRTAILKTLVFEHILESVEQAPDDQAIETLLTAGADLSAQLEHESFYPAEFIAWRLTGHREIDSGESLSGAVILRELAVLVQRASALRPRAVSAVHGGARDLHQVAADIGVSVRTLQRWRDDGLLMRQMLFPDGKVRLGISNLLLASFRDRHPERFQQAASFSRMTFQESHSLAEKAFQLIQDGNSPNQAARRLASQSGRSHEAIRQLIRRHRGERGPVRGAGGLVDDRERKLVLAGARRGLEIDEIGRRIGRSPVSTRRILAEARAVVVRELRPDWIHFAVFDQPDADQILLQARAVVHRPHPVFEPGSSLDTLRALEASEDERVLDSLLLPAMHLQRMRLSREIDQLPKTPPVGRLEMIETGLRRADFLRRRVGEVALESALYRVAHHRNLPISRFSGDAFARAVRFCIEVVSDMLDHFDPQARGGLEPRFDRRIALEVDKRIALRQRGSVREESALPKERTVDALLSLLEPARLRLGLSPHLVARLDRLVDGQAELVMDRYGLGRRQPQSLDALAAQWDVPVRRMHRILAEAVRQLRGEAF
ncbi:MAG TPA: hypothetical protein DCX60_06190 [Phycisphaerales bacterium]|nr:hypothetical protein [Phycisphaerales bacterium]